MIRGTPWFRELAAVGWPIALYWVGLVLSLLVFSSSVVITQDTGIEAKDLWVLSAIWFGSMAGAGVGQLVSITRLRSSLFLPLTGVVFFVTVYVLAVYEKALEAVIGEVAMIMLIMTGLLGSIMASGGFWSLRVNRGLLAFWGPTLLAVGGILIVSQHYGYDDEWHAGNKHAIWSFGTVSILVLAVALQVVFMAARERHRLHRWMTAPQAAELVQQRPDPIRPFAGLGTWIAMAALVLALTFSSAIVAPYLWRTGPGDGSNQQIDPDGEPDDGSGAGMPDLTLLQQVMQKMQQLMSMMCTLLTMLVLALAALVIFGPPTRRQLLLAHLRSPMWPVTPSRRADLHWRLAEIAMGDAGVPRLPGETALEAAQRTVALYPDVNLEALTTAAEIADRVAYGYTLDANDADTIGRAAEMTYQAVWDTLDELGRIRNTYRWL